LVSYMGTLNWKRGKGPQGVLGFPKGVKVTEILYR